MPPILFSPMVLAVLIVCFFQFFPHVEGFLYIPGLAPIARRPMDEARIEVNGLHSITNGVPYSYYDSKTPFCPPFEKAITGFSQNLGLGALLSGERPQWSNYVLFMLENTCESIECEKASRMSKEQVKWMQNLIEKDYRAHIMLDNIPAHNDGSLFYQGQCKSNFYKNRKESADVQRGYYLGIPSKCTGGPIYLNNHLHFTVSYRGLSPDEAVNYEEKQLSDGSKVRRLRKRSKLGFSKKSKATVSHDLDAERRNLESEGVELEDDDANENDLFTILDIIVRPFSIDWENVTKGHTPECNGMGQFDDENEEEYDNSLESFKVPTLSDFENGKYSPLVLDNSLTERNIAWTYTVEWREEPTLSWSSRWDAYFGISNPKQSTGTHYLFVMYSLMVMLTLAFMVSMIILRALRHDLARYNSILDISKDQQFEAIVEEHGWKTINRDVFRLPYRVDDLLFLVGSGSQVFFISTGMTIASLLGYYSPENRGSIMSSMLTHFIFSSILAGFLTAWLCQSLNLKQHWSIILKLAFGLPGMVFITFLFSNLVLRLARSTGAVPSIVLAMLFMTWLCILVPLTFLGATIGFKFTGKKLLPRVSPIPRPINTLLIPKFLQTKYLLLCSGATPFIVALFELRLIFSCIFQGLTYHFFGFLAVIFFLWSITCGLTSISAVYYRMCSEDYHWWWLSFIAPSSLGLHFMLYVGYFYCSVVQMTSVAATVLYLTYMGLLVLLYVLCSGAIGFLASWIFVKVIFTSVKFD